MLFVKVNLNQANHVNLFLELYSDFIFFCPACSSPDDRCDPIFFLHLQAAVCDALINLVNACIMLCVLKDFPFS